MVVILILLIRHNHNTHRKLEVEVLKILKLSKNDIKGGYIDKLQKTQPQHSSYL